MAENTKRLLNPKEERFWQPGPLTPQEIESLRQDRKECHIYAKEAFKDVKRFNGQTNQDFLDFVNLQNTNIYQ
ncbi:MAG: hypothetical protein LBD04_08975 [Synergistaceae bacterium]|jgi:hypothetical protein|nr:hypothetical protein [Synergistaceae bacterium]